MLRISSRGGNLLSFLCIWYGLNWTTEPYASTTRTHILFIRLFRLIVYSLPTTTSSVTGYRMMDLFYLLKGNFKNLLFDSLIMQTSFENLFYLSSCSLSQRWKFQRIRSSVLRGIELNNHWKSIIDILIGCIIGWVYQDSRPPALSAPKW